MVLGSAGCSVTSCLFVMMDRRSPISATEELTVQVDLFISFQDCCCVCMCFCAFLWLRSSEIPLHCTFFSFAFLCFKLVQFYTEHNAYLLIASLRNTYFLCFLILKCTRVHCVGVVFAHNMRIWVVMMHMMERKDGGWPNIQFTHTHWNVLLL